MSGKLTKRQQAALDAAERRLWEIQDDLLRPWGRERGVKTPSSPHPEDAIIRAAEDRLREMQVDLFRRYWEILNDALPISWQEEKVAAWRADLQRYERAAAALMASGVPELSAIAEREAPLAHEGGVQQTLAF